MASRFHRITGYCTLVGSALQYNGHPGEFYLHMFAPGKPDLNWEILECRSAAFEGSMSFWLRKVVCLRKLRHSRMFLSLTPKVNRFMNSIS